MEQKDKDSDDDSDLEILDVDLSIDVNKMEPSQVRINLLFCLKGGFEYFWRNTDFAYL